MMCRISVLLWNDHIEFILCKIKCNMCECKVSVSTFLTGLILLNICLNVYCVVFGIVCCFCYCDIVCFCFCTMTCSTS
jgi:hypothetical protein